jgi:hypothetical protein
LKGEQMQQAAATNRFQSHSGFSLHANVLPVRFRQRRKPANTLKNVPGARKSAPPTGWNAAAGSVTAASRPAATAMRTLLTIWNILSFQRLSFFGDLSYISRFDYFLKKRRGEDKDKCHAYKKTVMPKKKVFAARNLKVGY